MTVKDVIANSCSSCVFAKCKKKTEFVLVYKMNGVEYLTSYCQKHAHEKLAWSYQNSMKVKVYPIESAKETVLWI